MTETILDSLVVRLRADTSDLDKSVQSLQQNLGSLESTTSSVMDGMTTAFDSFARTGELSFEGLRRTALSVLDEIFGHMVSAGLSGAGSSGPLSLVTGLSSLLFGREGGGTVAPNRPYIVGEKGPELFMPHTPGRVLRNDGTAGGTASRVTNITVNVNGGREPAEAGRRSAGQIAVAVRRAVEKAERNL
ncbi:phage tail tape measure protein [Emcibacter nanhaiensis]|uniref:Phage tail tape measure protein n=1 Tax=Emcibacter nanhaiensis TaxID=1505037 RepID=A0A501PBK9_9PROT|nr:phage tail tape measure protein [Emcibacter nanhaiensis]TPD57740.1 phage tail tape measure protein [Emcibacter nanhaiensis]